MLTAHDHIQNMQEIAHKKSIVAMEKEERAQKMELTKARRAVEKILKDLCKDQESKRQRAKSINIEKMERR